MRKLTPIPPAATANPVYLMAAAISSLIQTLPSGTAYCIGIVLMVMVMVTGRLMQHKGSLARAALPLVLHLEWGWGSVLILLGYSFKETGDRNNSLFLEGGSTMVLELVECPVCGGTNMIKHGKSGEGKKRYLCQDHDCHGKTFIRDYPDLG